jgi:mono/diheme cytochrome c family protein
MKTLIMTHKVLWLVFVICILMLIFPVGCNRANSGIGFRLPDGNIEAGKVAFLELDCIRCHSIAGDVGTRGPEMIRDIHVVLGGETTRVKTYGHLVTSIVYPDHIILPKYRADYTDRDGNSEMPDMTEEMTVKQMIDLVTYLQTTYQVREPPSAYDMSYPGF